MTDQNTASIQGWRTDEPEAFQEGKKTAVLGTQSWATPPIRDQAGRNLVHPGNESRKKGKEVRRRLLSRSHPKAGMWSQVVDLGRRKEKSKDQLP